MQKVTPQAKLKIQHLDPKKLEVPDVRITSTWDPDMLEMFKRSVEAEGIQQPLLIVKDGEHLYIVDGLHRQQEALLKGFSTVPCVLKDGTMRQVMTKNLYMNRLRGGVKSSEMVKVIKWLTEKEKMNSEAINAETGLSRDLIEKLQETAKAQPEVIDALDREEIGVGHAWEIARVPDRDVQLRLLSQVFQYRLTVKDLHDVVEDTLRILKERADNPQQQPQTNTVPIPTIRCGACEQEYPLKKVVGVNLCISCYGLLHDEIVRRKKQSKAQDQNHKPQSPESSPPLESLTTERPNDNNDQSFDHQTVMGEGCRESRDLQVSGEAVSERRTDKSKGSL